MRTLKYITMGVLLITLTLSSMNGLFGQKPNIEFRETYSISEIFSKLDPDDRIFQLINCDQMSPKGSKLGTCSSEEAKGVWEYIQGDKFLKNLPKDAQFAWGVQEEDGTLPLFVLKQTGKEFAGPNENDLKNVSIQKENSLGNFGLLITFNEHGAGKWEALTEKNVGRNIAILIEGKVYTAPMVREKIKHGKCLISGNFTESEITRIKKMLDNPQDI